MILCVSFQSFAIGQILLLVTSKLYGWIKVLNGLCLQSCCLSFERGAWTVNASPLRATLVVLSSRVSIIPLSDFRHYSSTESTTCKWPPCHHMPSAFVRHQLMRNLMNRPHFDTPSLVVLLDLVRQVYRPYQICPTVSRNSSPCNQHIKIQRSEQCNEG